MVREDPFASCVHMRFGLIKIDVKVCRQIAIGILKAIGFGAYFTAHEAALTEQYMKRRLLWAQQYVSRTEEQWASVI